MNYESKCHQMALMAQYAYLDGKDAKKLYSSLGYKNHKFIENEGAQCHVLWSKEEFIIAFRGTEPSEFSDIKADLNALPDRANNGSGWVHNGFQTEVDKIWDSIVELLPKADKKKMFICGHSLGGAMATIATSRLDHIVDALYTYGSPRVGTRKFTKSFYTPHYRHVNNNDVVPSVPFAIMGYTHHCPSRYINYYGNIRSMTWWQRVKDQWRGRFRAWQKGVPFDGAYDHGMDHYVKYTECNDGDH